MPMDLDAVDRHILTLLQTDAELSTAEIADRVGLSQAPCWRRIRRMEEAGIIRMHATLLDRKKLGLNVLIFAHVKLAAHGRENLPAFEDTVRRFPEVLECYTLLGATDYILKVVTKDVESYERFFREHLSQLPAVQETNSAIALSEIKNTTALPLSLLG
ncbi:Lrp/AsnC family transcriptional regulator [Azospirillum doebereinerae]